MLQVDKAPEIEQIIGIIIPHQVQHFYSRQNNATSSNCASTVWIASKSMIVITMQLNGRGYSLFFLYSLREFHYSPS
jgi:hypothetical protein